ncbi:MAG: NUDIX hydrolase [Verrucomicrobia bacterium]|nr:NUDIX hydrolase [Verrucomicrobiota bacterium]
MKKIITIFALLFCLSANAQVVFQIPPKNFSSKMEVSICFIKDGDRVLFLKRQFNKPEGNTWGIPGGKLDPGETAKKAVIREVSEETGIELDGSQVRYFGKVYAKGEANDVILHVFETTVKETPDVTINPVEHQDYLWVTLDDSLQLPLISGEEECIELFYG